MLGCMSRMEQVTDTGGGLSGHGDAWRLRNLDVSSTRCNSGNENALFGQVVNDNENCGEPRREGQLFDEVHRYRIPGAQQCRKGFQEAIRFMPWGLTMLADDARDTI